jgi:metal-responsive CopG/Arc/MetJ family transcriptional regulator
MTTKRIQRRPLVSNYRKLAVSVPSKLVEAIEGEVAARHAASVSAFISDAVEEKLERDCLQEALDSVWAQAPMTKKERAWADKILRA